MSQSKGVQNVAVASVQNVAVTLIAKAFPEETFRLAYRNESLELFFSSRKLLFEFIFAVKVNYLHLEIFWSLLNVI
jgi:hypothetical protein